MSLAAKLMLSPLLVAQALLTRARLPRLPEPDGERHGVVGEGAPLRLLILGDSSAAGVGSLRICSGAAPATPRTRFLARRAFA